MKIKMKLKISYEMRNVVEDVNYFTYSFIEEKLINRERKEKNGIVYVGSLMNKIKSEGRKRQTKKTSVELTLSRGENKV